MKIAIVGSGISGLSAAYYLSKKHHVDLFEREDHFGGHSHTLDLNVNNKKIAVDIGFIVFNHKTYPNLSNFFKEINVDIEKSDMSFSVSVENTKYEYCGKGLSGMFANKINIFNPKFLKMFINILDFYKQCTQLSADDNEIIRAKSFPDPSLKGFYASKITLGEFLKKYQWSEAFINYHLIPMVSAIWSMPPYEASKMPFNFFLKFFQNHGLFKLINRPQWFTVSNRSRTYVNKILSKISGEYFKNYKINLIKRISSGVQVYYGGGSEFFNYDKVVIATHADEALSLIDNPMEEEKNILSNFSYKENLAIIHTDNNIMPKNLNIWSSWNSCVNDKNPKLNSLTYWLNNLQNLNCDQNIFLTLNSLIKISENKILKKIKFTHPYFDQNTLDQQKKLKILQNKKNILFCGSYFGYGFHEDGIKSSIEMIKTLDD